LVATDSRHKTLSHYLAIIVTAQKKTPAVKRGLPSKQLPEGVGGRLGSGATRLAYS